MGQSTVEYETTVRAPLQLVFDRLTDHEAMNDWPGVSSCHLREHGTPRNGLGAVRVIKTNGITLHEKVVIFEPPTRFGYRITRGLPIDHLGLVTLSQEGQQVRISWHISMASKIPLLARAVAFQLRRGLPIALAYFVSETERVAQRAAS